MPSNLHEGLLLLFRNSPRLAADLLRGALHAELPDYEEARTDSAEISDIQPAQYRADLVVQLYGGRPLMSIVLEVQLGTDRDKPFVWPLYVVNLRARLRCPVRLLVIAADDAVARWAAQPIDLGGGNFFTPSVLALSQIPAITEEEEARADPELTVLSAIAHGRDSDIAKAARIALLAEMVSAGLDIERSKVYVDLVYDSLTEEVQQALTTMDQAKYEYKSEFARRYVAQGLAEGMAKGKAEGKAEGQAELVLKLLALKYGTVPKAVQEQVLALQSEQLSAVAARILRASTLHEAVSGP